MQQLHPSQDTRAIQAFQSELTRQSQAASGSSGFWTNSGLQVQRLASAFGQTHTAELLSIQPDSPPSFPARLRRTWRRLTRVASRK